MYARWHSVLLAALVLLTLTACLGNRAAVPTAVPATNTVISLPTTTPPPSVTPPPAATATPTETALPASPSPSPIAATPAPAAPATPDPNEGVGDVLYQDSLDGTSTWFWGFSDDVASFGVENGQLKAVMSQANQGWRFTISPDTLNIGNQQVRVTTHTVSCAENDEYGLLFRVRAAEGQENQFDGYLFKLRCGGAARFELVQGSSNITPLVDWTPSPAIQAGAPADNTLMVWMHGDQFRFYVNDQYLFSAQDSTLSSGFYGLYIYDRTAGGLTVNFEDLVARAVNLP